MLREFFAPLFVNISIMIGFAYTLNRLQPFNLHPNSGQGVKFFYALGFFLLSLLVYQFGFTYYQVTIDFHLVPVMVAGFFGGPVTGGMSGLLIGLYHLFFRGWGGAGHALAALVLGLGSGFCNPWTFRRHRFYVLVPALGGAVLVTLADLIEGTFRISQPRFWAGYFIFLVLHVLVYILMVGLLRDLTVLNEHYQRLEREATLDGMTGLFNFRYFDNTLREFLEAAVRRADKLTVAFIDIDHFKKINDTYGHQVGDEVLRQLAEVIRHSLRPFDVAARYGGEEFAAILPGCNAENALKVGERIRRNVEQKIFAADGLQLRITVSVGVTTFPDYAQNEEELIRQSDMALYRAKQMGRNRVVAYFQLLEENGEVGRRAGDAGGSDSDAGGREEGKQSPPGSGISGPGSESGS